MNDVRILFFLIAGIAIVLFGLRAIVNPDSAWKYQERRKQQQGISEPTPEWRRKTIRSAIFSVVVGIIFILVAIFYPSGSS
jgi:heme/copper-type cytochrome/quinol oxidase subunit 2